MHINKTKYNNFVILTVVLSFIATLSRLTAMIFAFDFKSFFYTNDIIPYSVYIIYIICGTVLYLLGKNFKESDPSPRNKVLYEALLALTTIVFIALAIIGANKSSAYFGNIFEERTLLKNITNAVYPIFAALSAIYFLLRLFLKNPRRHSLSLLALSPVVFFAILLVERFSVISASATSLSHFPDVISLLFIAFYMLNEGKALIPKENQSSAVSTSIGALCALSLSFSAIPDLIFTVSANNELSLEEIFFLILKLIYIVHIYNNSKQKNN